MKRAIITLFDYLFLATLIAASLALFLYHGCPNESIGPIWGAPAPLPRPITRAEVCGTWVYDWTGNVHSPGWIALYPNGQMTEVWNGQNWRGTWKFEEDGESAILHIEETASPSPTCSMMKWHVHMRRNGGKIAGKQHNFRR